jgi:membrane fusion protein, multidrug efflux system
VEALVVTRDRLWRAAMLAYVPALAILGACGGEAAPVPRRSAAVASPGVLVDTATVQVPLSLPSQLYVEHDAVVAARSSGTVDALFADLGTRVSPGQPLARLESADQEIALSQAEAAYENNGRLVRRARAMAKFGGVTAADSEQVEFRYREAELALRKARRELELTRVVAPFAGIVTGRYVRPKRFVAVGETLFRVTERTPLLARVRLPEASAGAVRVGDAATVVGVGGVTATARVVRMAPAIDAGSGTREVVLQLAADTRLLPGASVVVRLSAERRRVVTVPRKAISADGYALVVEGNRSTLRAVTLGADIGDGRVEVVSGLAPGERVALPDR